MAAAGSIRTPRRVAVLGGSRIPFARADQPCARAADRHRAAAACGSPLAAGHPFAATGARIAAVLAEPALAEPPHDLQAAAPDATTSGRGLIPIRAAGGPGVAAITEGPASNQG